MDDVVIPNSAELELTPVVTLPRKPRVWTVFLVLFAALLLQVVFAGTIVLVVIASSNDPSAAAKKLPETLAGLDMFMLLVGSAELAFGLAAIGAAWASPAPFKERLGLLPARPSWLVYPLTMFGSWAVLALGIGLAVALTTVLPADAGVQTLMEGITLAQAVPFVLFIALPPGVCEELIFRGYMQRRFVERWKPGVAILVTSLIFALVHGLPHTMVAVFPLGVWFGFVAWRSGSIYPVMLCHAFVNGSLNAWRMVVKFAEVSEVVQIAAMVASVIVGVLCFAMALRLLIPVQRDMAKESALL